MSVVETLGAADASTAITVGVSWYSKVVLAEYIELPRYWLLNGR